MPTNVFNIDTEISGKLTLGGTSDVVISTTGNVGIGVALPSTKLEVSGVITATGGTSTNWNTAYGWGDHAAVGYLTSFTETDPVFSASAAAGITSTNISNWNTAYGWGNHATAGYLTGYTETQTLDDVTSLGNTTSNNIEVGPILEVGKGISTTSAFAQFGNLRTGSGYAYIDLVGDTTYTDYGLRMLRGNGGANTWSEITHRGTGTFGIGTNEAAPLQFKTSNAERMRITSGGNVGIGTTSPSRRLDVDGIQGWQLSNLETAYLNPTATGADFALKDQNNANIIRLDSRPSAVSYFNGGNVGIGTTSPDRKLHVVSNGVIAEFKSTNSGTSGYAEVLYENDAGDQLITGSIGSGYTNSAWAGARYMYATAGDLMIKTLGSGTNLRFYTAGATNERMRINGSGNVGIGTTSPSYKLHVAGNSYIDATSASPALVLGRYSGQPTIKAGSDDGGWLIMDSNGSLTSINHYTSNPVAIGIGGGNVGIGTTSPAYKLDIVGDTYTSGKYVSNSGEIISLYQSSWNTGNQNHYVLYNGWRTNTGDYLMIKSSGNQNTGEAAMVLADGSSGGRTYFGTHAAQSPANDNALTPLDSTYAFIGASDTYFSSNVGIGATSPAEKLHVLSSGNTVARFETSLTSDMAIELKNSQGSMFFGLGGGEEFAVGTDADLNGANSKFVITQSGNVGIGTTSPAQKLHVEGGAVYATGGTNNAKYISLFVNDSWGYLQTDAAKFYLNQELRVDTGLIGSYNEDLQLRTSAVTRMTINNTSGNVGIGTTSPGQKLDVSGNVQGNNIYANDSSVPSLYMERGDGTPQPVIRLVKSNDNLLIGHTAIDEVIFYDDAGEAMRLNGTGNLGIGTTSPAYKLDVYGSARIGGSNGDVDLVIEADADNSGENDNPRLLLKQDGGLVNGQIGLNGDANAAFTGAASNSMYLHNTGYPVHIASTNTLGLTVDTSGNVLVPNGDLGIGTTSPGYTLDVNGSMHSTNITIADYIYHEGNTVAYMGFGGADFWKVQTGGTSRLEVYNTGTFVNNNLFIAEKIGHTGDSNTYMRFPANDTISWDTNGSERIRITSTGNVGIGTTAPSEKLEVSGNILASGDITAYSDARLKENVETLPNALESVKAMRGVTYNKIGEEKQSIGVIAQEVQAVLPQLVSEHKDEMLSVAYGNITAVLIEAIKEQQEQIDELKAIINGLTK